MGFYIRKSLKFGPVRFNLSKSGDSVSAGVKGFRFGCNPRGNYIHMGRHGLYYRQSLPNLPSRSKVKGENIPTTPTFEESDILMEEIDSEDVGQIRDSSSENLVNEISSKRKKVKYSKVFGITLLIVIALILFNGANENYLLPSLIVLPIGYLFLRYLDASRKTTVIFYDMDKDSSGVFKRLYDSFVKLRKAKKIWHIPAKGDVSDSKYHAGANQLVKRNVIGISFSNPEYIKTNIPTPCIPVGSQKIYFFPDRILIFDKNGVGGLSYENLNTDISTVNFVEDEGVPSDSKVVDRTWRYVNKRGGPDKRFKDNKELPVAEYQTVYFSSDNGLNELIHISKVGVFEFIVHATRETVQLLKKRESLTSRHL